MQKQKALLVNGKRLKKKIEEYADYGRTNNNGVTRLALTNLDLSVRRHFQSECEKLGMTVVYDDIANMYATLPGVDNNQPPVVIGSHLDSVKKGGRFDGVLGVLAGLEVVRVIVENNIIPQVPLVVANITNEEGARFEPALMCSGILSGRFDKAAMMQSTDSEGVTFKKALQNSGFEGREDNRLTNAAAFLELHIEQGPVLEAESLQIGVVEGVVGMVNYEIEVTGDSNHAGTTPMHLRKDPLFATNNLITELREKMDKLDDKLVYTIGQMNISPNIHTVIPSKVVFTIEARHKEAITIRQVEEVIHGLPESVSKEKCDVKVTKQWDRNTVWFDENIVNKVEQSTKDMGYSYKRIVSGAGHDAQFIGTYIPTAMIFVPSVNGKSHAEDELTHFGDCENGVNVMLQTVLDLVTD